MLCTALCTHSHSPVFLSWFSQCCLAFQKPNTPELLNPIRQLASFGTSPNSMDDPAPALPTAVAADLTGAGTSASISLTHPPPPIGVAHGLRNQAIFSSMSPCFSIVRDTCCDSEAEAKPLRAVNSIQYLLCDRGINFLLTRSCSRLRFPLHCYLWGRGRGNCVSIARLLDPTLYTL